MAEITYVAIIFFFMLIGLFVGAYLLNNWLSKSTDKKQETVDESWTPLSNIEFVEGSIKSGAAIAGAHFKNNEDPELIKRCLKGLNDDIEKFNKELMKEPSEKRFKTARNMEESIIKNIAPIYEAHPDWFKKLRNLVNVIKNKTSI